MCSSVPERLPSHATVLGLDIGGTKCAASVLRAGAVEEILRMPTGLFEPTLDALMTALHPHAVEATGPVRVGISCGGPLDAAKGVILAPPNLPPSWHNQPVVARVEALSGGHASLMNDANACALAEWHFGAGRGTQHMIFLTSGTGMGSGLILNGRLYEGATGDAGEIGHVRLRAEGPVGYHKAGSVEGFTSGAGIARLAEAMLAEQPVAPSWITPGKKITMQAIAEAATQRDPFASEVLQVAGERLGETLAILIDLFNPERIVLGGFYPRCRTLLDPHLQRTLAREALLVPRERCKVVPSELGETIGSHGAIAVALHAFSEDLSPSSRGGRG